MRFERPEAFALFALAVPLVALHLRWLRRRTVEVPSLLLWRELGVAGRGRRGLRRLRDALALALLLAALGGFVTALAEPVTGARAAAPRALVIVLDASASMNARGAGRGSRFDDARDAALAALERAGPADPVTLWSAVSPPRLLLDPTLDHAAARTALLAARPTLGRRATGTTTDLALRAARASAGADATVLVFTDAPGAEALAVLPDLDETDPRRVVAVAGARDGVHNAGILETRAVPGEPWTFDVIVAVTDGEPAARRVVALRDGRAEGGVDVAFGAEGRGHARVALVPGPDVDPLPGTWELRLEPPDDFAEDDAARLVVRAARPLRVAVVAAQPSSFLVAALAAMPDVVDAGAARHASPGATAEALGDGDVVIAEGAEPPRGLPSLVFVADAARVSERPLLWAVGEHPLLRGVDLSPLRIERAAVLDPLPGEVVVAASTGGPVIVAGERAGARTVTVGFLPGATTLPLEAAFPLLVRNSLRWLARPPLLPPWVAAGEPIATSEPLRADVREVVMDEPGADAPRMRPVRDGAIDAVAPLPPPGGPYALRLHAPGGPHETVVRWTPAPGFRIGTDAPAPYPTPAAAAASLPDRRHLRDTLERHARVFAAAGAAALLLGAALLGIGRRAAPPTASGSSLPPEWTVSAAAASMPESSRAGQP